MPRTQAPPDIARAGITAAPILYEWNGDVSDDILWVSGEDHPSLARALTSLSLRAGMALLAATAEWVAWRLAGLVDTADALQRIEAGYAAAVDPTRVQMPMPGEPFPDDNGAAHGPLKLARMLLSMGFGAFCRGDHEVLARAFAAILLARHVMPGAEAEAAFEAWLADVLRRANLRFPHTRAPLAEQPAIAPSFFEAGADADDAGLRRRMDDFIASLSPSANPYLRPAARQGD